jgi:hypothetical protein
MVLMGRSAPVDVSDRDRLAPAYRVYDDRAHYMAISEADRHGRERVCS